MSERKLSTAEVKKIEKEMLSIFDSFCACNGLYYTLAGGTLLGAIRHKGFIPWDDDIDILMPRPDYDRLLNDIDLDYSVLPEYLSFANWKNKSFDYPFIKLLDQRTRVEIPYINDGFKANKLWIDVFPMDGMPDDAVGLKRLFKKVFFYRQLIRLKTANPFGGKTTFKRLVKPILVIAVKCLNNQKLCERLDRTAREYPFESHKHAGGVLWGYGPQERIDKDEFLKPIKVEFEGELFNAPSNYDQYLTGLYGDYMKLPPEEKRITHEMTCYITE